MPDAREAEFLLHTPRCLRMKLRGLSQRPRYRPRCWFLVTLAACASGCRVPQRGARVGHAEARRGAGRSWLERGRDVAVPPNHSMQLTALRAAADAGPHMPITLVNSPH
jgi:hypothetical protein